jgi:hypothetical protein
MSDFSYKRDPEGEDLSDDMVYDPSVPQQEYMGEEEPQEEEGESDFASEYLKTLYQEYETKVKSATVYLEKIQKQQETLTGITKAWTRDLKEKYTLLDTFRQNRPKTSIPSDFAVEQQGSPPAQGSGDLKKTDSKITDNSERINYSFNKLEDYLGFLGQTYLDTQDIINKIYDRYMEIYDNM